MSQHVFRASDHEADNKIHLLVASTGSVATIKLPQLLKAFSSHPALSIRVVLTQSASEFLKGQAEEQPTLSSLSSIKNVEAIYTDADEWDPPWTRSSPVLHIELRRWAHAMLIAPLSANSLAKIANGISDNLALSVVRAWDTLGKIDAVDDAPKRIWVAPAMNTAMWMHPVTAKHLKVLEEEWRWFTVLPPIEKVLACGDVGGGAMMEWQQIVSAVEDGLGLQRSSHEGW